MKLPLDTPNSWNRKFRWAVQLAGVREVSMLGAARLNYWKAKLQHDQLIPVEKEDLAQILIIAADAKYVGLAFREISFSVLVHPPGTHQNRPAACLIQAFNSNRFFAFCERRLFLTPYNHGDVQLAAQIPASIRLSNANRRLFDAKMGTDTNTAPHRKPLSCGEGGWEGPVFLPTKQGAGTTQSKYFVARVHGQTFRYPFDESVDSWWVHPNSGVPIFESLVVSEFVPTEWSIRECANHAKSKTYKRSNLIAS